MCRRISGSSFVACVVTLGAAWAVQAQERTAASPVASKEKAAVERGIGFLDADATRWRKAKICSTCHHGTLTMWTFTEAKLRGFPIADEKFNDTVKWAKTRLENIDKPRDTRPGWSMVNSLSMYMALMAALLPGQETISAKELKQITGHLLRHQEADGSWAWSSAPPKNRPPPFFESDEVATLLAYLVLGAQKPTDGEAQKSIREAREKAAAWLAKLKPTDTTQASALRLLVKVREPDPGKSIQPEIDAFLSRQNKDGGWPQLPNAASDAYATGQALYILNVAGVKPDRAEIRRGVTFLVSTQKDDGSWPMIPRAHEGTTPAKNTEPITYFGSVWATLGLMRSITK